MAQFKVGDKVSFTDVRDNNIDGVISGWHGSMQSWGITCTNGKKWFVVPHNLRHSEWVESLTITATLTTDTIPTDMLKQLSAAGFLITIKAV